ncbi:flippase [Synechococcus sp. BDU 130192]|uniref:flippase n=1 Tax=Synechococcus sp. BDU 130192 TaxID=2042059 RepID=UPI000C0806FD|nr:flippase [Synechococcus sp. BDU 130192]
MFKRLSLFKKQLIGEQKAILSNISWLSFEYAVRMIIGFFMSAWMARYLGAAQLGTLNYAGAIIVLLHPLSKLGLDTLVIRSLVNFPQEKNKILGTVFWLKLVISSIISLGLIATGVYLFLGTDNTEFSLIFLILSSSILFQAFEVVNFWFSAQVQSKYIVAIKILVFIVVTLSKVALLILQVPLIYFAWIIFGEAALEASGFVLVYQLKKCPFKLEWNTEIAKSLLHESWPLILSGLSIILYMKTDLVMLGSIVGEEAVGIYSSATKISEIWYFIPNIIIASVSPSIYAAKEKNKKQYYEKIKDLLSFLIRLSLMISLPILFTASPLILMIYGPEYFAAGTILKIHIWATLFVFMGTGTSPWFIAEKLSNYSFWITFSGALLNIILNIFLIPKYSGVGAAISTVISQLFSGFLINAFFSQTRIVFRLQLNTLNPLKFPKKINKNT